MFDIVQTGYITRIVSEEIKFITQRLDGMTHIALAFQNYFSQKMWGSPLLFLTPHI